MRFLLGERAFDLKSLSADPDYRAIREPVMACGEGLPEADAVYVFRSEQYLLEWGTRLSIGKALTGLYARIEQARGRPGSEPKAAFERQKLLARRLEEDLRNLAKQTGLAPNSKELLLRATVEADPLEGSYFDAAVLYTGLGFTGNAIGTIAPLASLAIFPGMNNAVSSVQVVGACGLFNGTFFTGASRWLFGVPYFQIANLTTIGFNNLTSSAYAYYI